MSSRDADDKVDSLVEKARAIGLPPERVFVWSVMADLFLDYDWGPELLYDKAVAIARSPFSYRELAHILYYEVNPYFCGGSSHGSFLSIDLDELLRSCKLSYDLSPFDHTRDPDSVPLEFHFLASGAATRAHSVLKRVKKMRDREKSDR
ncbi:MAG: hypothetical protein IPM23_11465 [Candidatus Melainabacteria bacterium]|nr:hypothetical protein [Candidatus Melainabacteria bacterium]